MTRNTATARSAWRRMLAADQKVFAVRHDLAAYERAELEAQEARRVFAAALRRYR